MLKQQMRFQNLLVPVIDLNATDPSALYSLLLCVEEQCKKRNIQMPSVTNFRPTALCPSIRVSSKNVDICSIRWIPPDYEFSGFNWFADERQWLEKCP